MQITEVKDSAAAKDFIRINALINSGNPQYIQPLDNEVNDVFDPAKNKAFKHGEAKRWILKDKNGKLTGRIAAFINTKYTNHGDTSPVGLCGFF